jgi:hypothetical protein
MAPEDVDQGHVRGLPRILGKVGRNGDRSQQMDLPTVGAGSRRRRIENLCRPGRTVETDENPVHDPEAKHPTCHG